MGCTGTVGFIMKGNNAVKINNINFLYKYETSGGTFI